MFLHALMLLQIASLPPATMPAVGTPYTLTDSAFAVNRAQWIQEGVSRAGYSYGGSMGFGRGFIELHYPIDLSSLVGAKLVGDASTTLYRPDGGRVLDLTGAKNATLRDLTLRGEVYLGRWKAPHFD